MMSHEIISDCSELSRTQEEAGSRIILRNLNADKLNREFEQCKRLNYCKVSGYGRSGTFNT